MTVRWPAGASPSRYDLQFSDDGSSWRTVRHIEHARGDMQHHLFPDAQARAVRVLADMQPAADRARRGRRCERVLHAHRQAVAPGRVPARLHRRAIVLDRLRRRRRTRRFAAERGRRGRAGARGRRARTVSRQRRARRELGRRAHQPLVARRRPADAGHALARRRPRPGHRRLRRRHARHGAGDRSLHGAQRRQADSAGGARARLAALPGESADAVPRPSRRRQPDRHRDLGRRRPLGQRRAAPEAHAATEQRSRRACRGRAGRRLARAGAAGRPGDERQRPRWLRQRRAALRHAASVLARTEPSTSSCRSRASSLPASVDVGREQAARRRALACHARPGRHRRARRGRRRRPDAAHRPRPRPGQPQRAGLAARAHGPMRDRGFETGR